MFTRSKNNNLRKVTCVHCRREISPLNQTSVMGIENGNYLFSCCYLHSRCKRLYDTVNLEKRPIRMHIKESF